MFSSEIYYQKEYGVYVGGKWPTRIIAAWHASSTEAIHRMSISFVTVSLRREDKQKK